MTLASEEFMRRFLLHVLPSGAFTASATMACSPTPIVCTISPPRASYCINPK
jgi:hypothetical protein